MSDSDNNGEGFRTRARLRRRARELEREKEHGLRDVGGLMFELHRAGESNQELVDQKLTALGQTDSELVTLQTRLDDRADITELHEPGIIACTNCGEIIGSSARFCSNCGTQQSPK